MTFEWTPKHYVCLILLTLIFKWCFLCLICVCFMACVNCNIYACMNVIYVTSIFARIKFFGCIYHFMWWHHTMHLEVDTWHDKSFIYLKSLPKKHATFFFLERELQSHTLYQMGVFMCAWFFFGVIVVVFMIWL
jgi:hypothetical protein